MSSGSGSGGGSGSGHGSGAAKIDPGQVAQLQDLGKAAGGGASALASFLGIDAANFTSNPADKPHSGAGSGGGSGSGGGASS
jgi:hypothetical protein